MTPVSTTLRGAILLLATLALLLPVAHAQAVDAEEIDFAFSVHEGGSSPFAFDVTSFSAPAGSVVMIVYNSAGATAPHNVHATEGAVGEAHDAPIDPDSGKAFSTFTMPESGEVTYVCDVHPEMTGTVEVGAFSAGGGAGGHGVQVNRLGVNFLAHWVGVVAFAALFVVYGITFFLFKYNETPFTTDHKDRAVAAGASATEHGEPFIAPRATVVALTLLLIVVVLAILWWLGRGA